MTSKMKIVKLRLYEYQMKASNPGNLKIAMEIIFVIFWWPLMNSYDPLITSNLKIKKLKLEVYQKEAVTQAI